MVLIAGLLFGCGNEAKQNEANSISVNNYQPVTVMHELGTTQIKHRPQKVVALDMNEVDALSQLDIPVAGMPKDFVPHFLSHYQQDSAVQDLGAIIRPNMERVFALQPDLILISSLQANHYKTLSELAPTVHFDANFLNSGETHIENVKKHFKELGKIFAKQSLVEKKLQALDNKLKHIKSVIKDRSEKAMIIMHNNGAFRFFGINSRYGFIYNELGVKPASTLKEVSSHGQPISHEFMLKYNPDIIYIIDRSSIMEHRTSATLEELDTPFLRETKAWKNNRVSVADAQAWYITGASYTSIMIMLNEILAGYGDIH